MVVRFKKSAASALLSGLAVFSAASFASPPQMLPEVEVITAKEDSYLIQSELTGRVVASQTAPIRPEVSGVLKQKLFEEGSFVREGDVLYVIDDSLYVADFNRAKAAATKAAAHNASLIKKVARFESLAKVKATSQQDLEDYQSQLAVAQADLAAAAADLERSSILLSKTRITAPISGIIGNSFITEGELLTANQLSPLAEIQQISPVYVDLLQPSARLTQTQQDIASGKLSGIKNPVVELRLENGDVYGEKGTVNFSQARVEPSLGTVTLRTEFENKDSSLLPGMFVRATVAQAKAEKKIALPHQAVSRNAAGQGIAMIVTEVGEVEPRMVETFHSLANQWLINSGIENGELVIVKGLQKARPGEKVSTTPYLIVTGSKD